MGRLPATFGNQPITDRFPYAMPGELVLTDSQSGIQFQDALFNNGVDKPFECHRLIPRVYALDDAGVMLPTQPDERLLAALVKINITITNLEQKLTKASAAIDTLTKGSAERSWEFADPFYLIKSNNITVSCDTRAFPVISDFSQVLVAITLEGFFCICAPPTPNR